ncbi:SAM-dependent methyltransferase [uncultured Desulfosarcina sp.]|uniref:SAM-dependent methyltransferase n=1 Tax=uncultured Desulfosarcina sp. TaxID=218289 RepID=UPI0029C9AF5B|nr:SAM-dependent methyltransferase [uncultured Desulfosarcina sp.]
MGFFIDTDVDPDSRARLSGDYCHLRQYQIERLENDGLTGLCFRPPLRQTCTHMEKGLPMQITFTPIGTAHPNTDNIPRHWTVSDVEGSLVIDPQYTEALADIAVGQRIMVLFHFHKSPPFSPNLLKQTPPHRQRPFGVFSICSPRRPNPIGLSVLEVLSRDANVLGVRGMDMIEGTPILDIKPFVDKDSNLPSREDAD